MPPDLRSGPFTVGVLCTVTSGLATPGGRSSRPKADHPALSHGKMIKRDFPKSAATITSKGNGGKEMAKTMKYALAALGACLLATGIARAGTVNEDDGIAIKGYDPVAYFTDNKPVKGTDAYSFTYEGVTYEFASAAHRDLFASAPEKYAPQFGGFCAYGAATGHKAAIDPTAFTIVDGKLYLNYSGKVRDAWQKDEAGYISKATAAWPTVSQQTDVVR